MFISLGMYIIKFSFFWGCCQCLCMGDCITLFLLLPLSLWRCWLHLLELFLLSKACLMSPHPKLCSAGWNSLRKWSPPSFAWWGLLPWQLVLLYYLLPAALVFWDSFFCRSLLLILNFNSSKPLETVAGGCLWPGETALCKKHLNARW